MTVPVEKAKMVLRMLVEGSSIRSADANTGFDRNTICKLVVHFGRLAAILGRADARPQTDSLQFDEQWTYVAKKQSRLTINERAECSDSGDIYLWTCIDQKTKLLPSFLIGKRSADNARRFMMDVASRLAMPKPHASDATPSSRAATRPSCKSAPMVLRPTRKRLTSPSAPTSATAR